MRYKKTIAGLGIVLLFGLIASLPLFGKGYIPTHDGEYHIIRFIEFFKMVSSGYMFPRWAPTLNSGYGIPIFLFHYPFPNYIGVCIQLIGFHAVDAFKLTLAFGYLTTIIFSYLWLKKIYGVKAGITGAIASACVPYWFVDLYVRGSVGEVWAIAFLFISFMLLEYRLAVIFPIAIAGLILSHNILAMVFLPLLLGYILLRDKKYLKGVFIGVVLASYFWIPALMERMYVVGLNTVNFREHFAQVYELIVPSWGTELSGQMFGGTKMSFQIGILPIFSVFWSLILIIKERNKLFRRIYWYFLFIFFISIFLILSPSVFLWDKLPFLSYVQYPWRFLSMVIPLVAWIIAYISYRTKMRFISIVLILTAFIFSYSYMRPVIYEPRDEKYYSSRINFTDGTSSMGNSFSTIWTGWKNKRPEYLLEVVNGRTVGDFSKNSYLEKRFVVMTETGADVHVPTLYYPGWSVLTDNSDTPINYKIDGTIRFFVPPGKHTITVVFVETGLRKVADTLSFIALVWLIGWGILEVYANRHRHIST